jgi:hypothetical protein
MSKSSNSSSASPIAKPTSNADVTSLPTLDSSTLPTDLSTPPTPSANTPTPPIGDVSVSSNASSMDVSTDVSTAASTDVSTGVSTDVSTAASTDLSSSNCDSEELVLKTCREKHPLAQI